MATVIEVPSGDPQEEPSDVTSAPTTGRGPFRPTPGGWAARAALPLGSLLVVFFYLHHFAPLRADNLSNGLIIAIGALSLNVLVGYSGQISLGHQAFIGIGAFTSAYVISQSHQSFYIALLVAALVGATQAVILGLVALRVRGLYFALVTLAWGAVSEQCIFLLKSFTGGGAGANAPKPGGFTTDRSYFVLVAVALTIILLIDWRLMASKAGRAMQALRESPQVAANYGVNVNAYTLLAFAVSGFYAGVAGALYASRRTTVQAVEFNFAAIALTYLIVTVVGGLRKRGGIVAFAILFELGAEWLPDLAKSLGLPRTFQASAGTYLQAVSGILAILTLIFQPEGLGTITGPIGKWLKGERFHIGHGGGGGSEGVDARP
jgi:branched-chain amino acid transport system permease protein